MSKNSTKYFVVLFLTMFYLVSCGEKFRMDYVPKPEQIKNTLSEFIIDEIQIEGLYANMDVDSMVFRYIPRVGPQTTVDDILSTIIEKAEKVDWKVSERQKTTIRLNRFRPGGRFFSAEEVRIKVNQENLKVYVAWVQADSGKPVSHFEETSEAKYAKKVVWPMLESYIAEEEKSGK